jgi:hypothetical protein
MMTNKNRKLVNKVEEVLNELFISYFKEEISTDDLMEELNNTIHYNSTFKPFIYEILFIQALRLKKIPKDKFLLSGLFCMACDEDYLLQENYSTEGTRIKILKKLNLKKTLKIYEDCLICLEDEPHTLFKKGVEDQRYKEANANNPSLQDVHESLLEELEDLK